MQKRQTPKHKLKEKAKNIFKMQEGIFGLTQQELQQRLQIG